MNKIINTNKFLNLILFFTNLYKNKTNYKYNFGLIASDIYNDIGDMTRDNIEEDGEWYLILKQYCFFYNIINVYTDSYNWSNVYDLLFVHINNLKKAYNKDKFLNDSKYYYKNNKKYIIYDK